MAGFGVHVPEHAILVAGIKGSVWGPIETSAFDHSAQSARKEGPGLSKLVTSRKLFQAIITRNSREQSSQDTLQWRLPSKRISPPPARNMHPPSPKAISLCPQQRSILLVRTPFPTARRSRTKPGGSNMHGRPHRPCGRVWHQSRRRPRNS